MEIRAAVCKIPKFGHGESGDTAELVERPRGGLSVLLADGQGHGRPAKRISTLVVSKALSLITEGARDGAVARAVHDYLYAVREGKVSATLTILSVDLPTRTMLVARNSHCPVLVKHGGKTGVRAKLVEPIGVHHWMKPAVDQWPLQPGSIMVTFTDGILAAGTRSGLPFQLSHVRRLLAKAQPDEVQSLADAILQYALELDNGKPGDDMTVVALGVVETPPERLLAGDRVRRLAATLPV